MALNLKKASPTALISAARGLWEKRRLHEAEEHLLAVLDRDLDNGPALSLLAEVYIDDNRHHAAMNCLMRAVNANPRERAYKERLIEISRGTQATAYGEQSERAITACLEDGDALDCANLQGLWYSHLLLNPAFQSAFRLQGMRPLDPANKTLFGEYKDFSPLLTPYVLLGLRHSLIGGLLFEEFLTHVRRHLLLHKDRFAANGRETLAAALSHYAFYTDYIFDSTEEEDNAVAALRRRIENGDTGAEAAALYACYAPLYSLGNAATVAEKLQGVPTLAPVVKRQIVEYNALRARAGEIPALTEIDPETSSRVQQQYEEFPYPRWRMMARDALVRGWKSRNTQFTGNIYHKNIQILNAGCGTGQEPAMLSVIFPKADILAIDLSRSSLAYAAGRAEEYGLGNIAFRHADILRLGTLNKKFDYITSMGVLHHMKDPVAGWKILADLLRPGGIMMIGLYSKTARRAILNVQKTVRDGGYKNDAASMKAFRRRAAELVSPEDLKDITGFRDYFITSMYRDMLFHVQETDYGLEEIAEILKLLNLEFLGFSLKQKVLNAYAARYPDDKNLNNLVNWRDFEEKNPATFRDMYYLWLRKAEDL